jgi:hypothetical protein
MRLDLRKWARGGRTYSRIPTERSNGPDPDRASSEAGALAWGLLGYWLAARQGAAQFRGDYKARLDGE